ncbi:Met-10+ like-protein-domain-containing protein [Pholiota molesta]|nr:Met-10+ like-protein-domain-containing protein [Pholiota molesta]
MLLARTLFAKRAPTFVLTMSRHLYLDASPPPYTGPRDAIDKTAFRKTFSVLGARVSPEKTRVLLRANELKDTLMDLPKIRTVVSDPSQPDGDRLVLLRMADKADIPAEAQQFLDKEAKGLQEYKVDLDYDYWTAEECLHAFLPEELREGAPTGFAMTGHIAHVNLNDEYLPYKHVIGQLILDKNKRVRTVVNKLDSIDTQFRFFKMELIAGVPEYVVEHHEADCKFTFDFTEVYWNSRLHTEHERLVEMFKPDDVIADVFAGVGPFAVPAAKKGCAVLGNDLNPNSAKYLSKNVEDNRVTDLVRVSCEDGRDFIRSSVSGLYDNPFPAYTGPKPSRIQEEKERKRLQKLLAAGQPIPPPAPKEATKPPRRRISHFVMNLPDSAITFLDAFRGILTDTEGRNLSGIYDEMPMVHCHCFTRELEPARAEADIRQRVEEKLGHPLTGEVKLHLVRSVAPNKEMYCISFRLPREAAFGL